MVVGRLVSAFYKSSPGTMPKLYFAIRDLEGNKIFPEPIDSPMRPFFYAEKRNIDIIEENLELAFNLKPGLDFHTVQTDLNFGLEGKGKAVRADLWEPWRVGELKRYFRSKMQIELFQADIPYIRNICIHHGIKAGIRIENRKISPYDGPLPQPKLLFLDIETDDSKGFPEEAGKYAVLCIGTTDDEGNENFFTWEWGKTEEADMFREFHTYAQEFDYLVVWNKDFEGEHLPKRAKELGLWLEWRIWRLLDLADYFRMFNLETHFEKLPVAYARTLKKFRGKLDNLGIRIRDEKIRRLPNYYNAWKSDPEDFKDVNISHAYALYVMEKGMEVIKLYSGVADEVGIFIDFTTMNSHIVDTLALRKIQQSHKWVIPSTRPFSKKKGFRGAVVFPAKRGVHSFIFLFDFTSLYNRIIQSYYLDPIAYYHWNGTFTENGVDEYIQYAKIFGEVYGIDVELEDETGKKYTEKLPIFPAILHQLERRRNFLKSERKKHAHGTPLFEMFDQQQKAAKVILLACYGVLGMSSSRWTVIKKIPERMILTNPDEQDFRVLNKAEEKFVGMVTYLARKALVDTKIFFDEDEMVIVIYGDTDSTFVQPIEIVLSSKIYKNLTEEDMETLLQFGADYGKKLEEFYKGRFESGIEMKLEKIFDRAVFGKAKKQYYCRTIWDEDAGWQLDSDGNLQWYEYTKGLPLVRTDRTEFLKTMQRKTLQMLLDSPKDIYPMWRDVIQEYFNNEYDHMLILRIGVKKRLEDYKSITPVVRAARKLVERGQQVRLGEKVAFIMIDVKDKKGVAEPIDETLDPKESIAHLPPLTKAALNMYWNKRIWKNIKPFLELVLDEREILKVELVKDGLVIMDQWFKPKA